MTATDELRRMLDECGVEWIGTSFSTPAKGHPTNTSLGEEHNEATFIEYDDGNVLRLFDLTPEQAIEATLGRGECHIEAHFGEWYCTGCGVMVGTCDPDSELCVDGNYVGMWSYCPNCGRTVRE